MVRKNPHLAAVIRASAFGSGRELLVTNLKADSSEAETIDCGNLAA